MASATQAILDSLRRQAVSIASLAGIDTTQLTEVQLFLNLLFTICALITAVGTSRIEVTVDWIARLAGRGGSRRALGNNLSTPDGGSPERNVTSAEQAGDGTMMREELEVV